MNSNRRTSFWLTVGGLGLLVVVAAYVRLYNLDANSISHPEMWVPGIPLPEGLSEPSQRLSLWKVLTGTFSSDTHPPGYYMLMWAWTKLFGAGIWSIRLPSALLGIASIPLLFWLATLTGQRTTAWVAATLLAVNGYHVFWSKVARMFSLACFLGLLATILLLLLTQENHQRRTLQVAYVLVTLLGLASHIFFWLLFITHVLWTFLNAWRRKQPMPGLCKLQILILILGSPLLAFAAYQSGNVLAVLSSNVLIYAREFLLFSFLFPMEGFSSGVFLPSSPYPPPQDPGWSIARGAFLIFSLLLLISGITSVRKSSVKFPIHSGGASRKVWVAAAGLGFLAVLTFVFMAEQFAKPKPNDTLQITKAMSTLPLVFAGIGILLQRIWHRVPDWASRLVDNRFFAGSQALVLMLTVLPFGILSIVSLFKPILNARGLLFASPYLLLLLAAGMVSLTRSRWVVVVLVLLMAVLHAESLVSYRRMAVDPMDFKGLATELAPQIEKSDLIFLQSNWSTTPILYYLTADRYRIVGRGYGEACRQDPNARVWALFFYNQQMPQEWAEVLANYRIVETIEVPHARAVLYSAKAF